MTLSLANSVDRIRRTELATQKLSHGSIQWSFVQNRSIRCGRPLPSAVSQRLQNGHFSQRLPYNRHKKTIFTAVSTAMRMTSCHFNVILTWNRRENSYCARINSGF